jgi:hypothetical protein
VWREWHAGDPGWLGPPAYVLIFTLLLGFLLLLLLAWLNLPWIHRAGSLGRSFRRAVRATAAVLWPTVVLTVAAGSLFVAKTHTEYAEGQVPFGFGAQGILAVSVVISLYMLATWLRCAIDAVAKIEPPPELPPVCEGCGYDLTHRPADERCSECGLALAESLDQQRSRPGCRWARGRSLASWIATAASVLRHPRPFYRSLVLRTPATAESGFAALHYVLIWCGAALWMCTVLAIQELRFGNQPFHMRWEDFGMVCFASAIGVFACGLGHRVLAALVATWWLLRGGLPDFRWAMKVVRYETAYLWVLCCCWGVFSALMTIDDACISDAFGLPQRGWPLGAPLEFWVLCGGSVVLVAFWLWRYEIAYRAIRWSNF